MGSSSIVLAQTEAHFSWWMTAGGATERAASEIEVRGSRHKEGVMFDEAAMQLVEDEVKSIERGSRSFLGPRWCPPLPILLLGTQPPIFGY